MKFARILCLRLLVLQLKKLGHPAHTELSSLTRMPATMKLLTVLLAAIASLIALSTARAQQDMTPTRLRNPATVNGFIGGESHDFYVIRARKGQTMTVRISWRREDKNFADFSVKDTAEFDHYVEFGKQSADGKKWSGKIPRTGDYYIDVVAHPTAHYTLRVTVR